jgi:uncharacterized membrane protein
MKPLFILLGVFAAALVVLVFARGAVDLPLAGRIAMSVMLLFTAIGHFAFVEGMAMMMPSVIPFKRLMVYATGLVEIAAAAGLLFLSVQHLTAWLLILFFVMILPANINAAIKGIDYQKASMEGSGPRYLWFRVPLQLFFIAWVYYFAVLG